MYVWAQLLSVFGVVLMILVGAVSLIITWTSDEIPSPADLPMFAPLMWIAVGIFTGMDCKWFGKYHSTEGACCLLMMDVAFLLPPGKAASVEVLSNSALTTPEIPVLTEKAVFPSDESDFELIRQHNGMNSRAIVYVFALGSLNGFAWSRISVNRYRRISRSCTVSESGAKFVK